MNEQESMESAREAVDRLFAALKIDTVVCVDDIYARSIELDDLLIAQMELTEVELRAIFGRPGDVFPEDRDVRQQSFREAWSALDNAQKRHVGERVLAVKAAKAPETPDDFVASSALADIVGVNRLQTVSPSGWTAVKARIQADNSAGKTLLLFDQDLSGDGGSTTGGMVLATDALTDATIGNRVMCGLLTHTVTIENQHDEWVRLAVPPLDQDRFVVVAKGWLSRDPLGFARMLKQVALTPNCRAMKQRTKELLDAATADAQESIEKIHIDDFENMVFRSSKLEGIWEQHTIELPHFSEDPDRTFYVRLRPTHSVHPCVLDLCIYNDDGSSKLELDVPCPDNVLPSWRAKYEYLKSLSVSVLKRYQSFGEGKIRDNQAMQFVKSETPKKFPIFTSNSELFKGAMVFEQGKRCLSFNCKRVMRLHRARAIALTTEYSQYLARPAFERDLTL